MAEVKGAAKSLKCCVNIRLVRIRIAESESKVFLRFKHLKDTKMRTIIYKNGIFRVFCKVNDAKFGALGWRHYT